MKNQGIFIALLVGAALTACQKPNTDIVKLREKRDSLAGVASEIDGQIAEIDKQIAILDSSASYTPVSILEVSKESFAHYFEVYGMVEGDRNVTLFAETAGKIERIHVGEGQSVRAGQPLISLDSDVIRNNIEEVKTSLQLATVLFDKQSALWAQNIGSEVQFLEAKNRKESLENTLATLNAQLEMGNLKAPFSGIVDEVFVKSGEYAAPGVSLVRLVNLNQVYVTADVPEIYVNQVKAGNKVSLYFSTLQDTVTSRIVQVGQFINPSNRTFRIKVGIDDSGERFKPNMMAGVRICDYESDSSIVVPNRILQQDPGGNNYLYVYSGGKDGIGSVKKTYVKPGVSYNGNSEILNGLEGDELIVDRGSRSVQDQELVQVVN